MQLIIGPDGSGRCLYGEDINLGKLGALTISRASHVEPDASGQWFASMIDGQLRYDVIPRRPSCRTASPFRGRLCFTTTASVLGAVAFVS
jgi:hypothetical protein